MRQLQIGLLLMLFGGFLGGCPGKSDENANDGPDAGQDTIVEDDFEAETSDGEDAEEPAVEDEGDFDVYDEVVDGGVDGGDANGDALPSSNCCQAGEAPGCDDKQVETCVCENNPQCCEIMWDSFCVAVAEVKGCAVCEEQPADCCTARETPGCEQQEVEACVCAQDPECCDTMWDAFCVLLLDTLSCGNC